MEIDWPSNHEKAERLYVLLAHNIMIKFQIESGFGCDPRKVTKMYIVGEQWQKINDKYVESLWEFIESVGMTNFDDLEAIRARFILSLLPREDALDQQIRFEWLLDFAMRLGISLPKLEESVKETLESLDRINDF